MNRNTLSAVIFVVSMFFFAALSSAEEGQVLGTLTVEVSGVRAKQGGNLVLALYRGKENWLRRGKVLVGVAVKVEEGVIAVDFDNISFSDTYALFVYHDKNANNTLDFRIFPFPRPREGVAVSNNAVRMGEPRYEKARFSVTAEEVLMQVKMHY